MHRDEVRDVVAEVLHQLQPASSPLLWTIREATARTSLARDELYRLYHAGEIRGLQSGPNSRILLKPESVIAYIDRATAAQVDEKKSVAARAVRGDPMRTA